MLVDLKWFILTLEDMMLIFVISYVLNWQYNG